jgi:hypothetical protein
MKKIIIFALFITAGAYAQNVNTDQNVELPEFVITGVERVDVPVVQKQKTDHVPDIVKGYIQQAPSADELKMAELSNPIKENSELLGNPKNINGRLEMGAGRYTLPMGELTYQVPYSIGLFTGKAYGFAETEYVDKAGLNQSGLDVQNSFFVNTKSGFLPGSEFKVRAAYDRTSFNFFGSETPDRKRNMHDVNLLASFYNGSGKTFKFGLQTSPEFFYLKEEDMFDNKIDLTATGELMFGSFSIEAAGGIMTQYLKNSTLGDNTYNGGGIKAVAKYSPFKFFSAGIGINVQNFDGENFASPVAEAAFKFSKQLSAYFTFAPRAELLTISDFVKGNRYYAIEAADNIFFEKDIDVTASIKYEYDKYFEINGGVNFTNSDNYPYYSDALDTGFFNMNVTKAARFAAFGNMLFHLGPYGSFYGDVTVQRVMDENDNYLTYSPVLISNLAYSYNFKFGLLAETKLKLASGSYADIANTVDIPEYIGLGVKLSYALFHNFNLFVRFDNLLNADNYYARYYEEKPLDLILGFNYLW